MDVSIITLSILTTLGNGWQQRLSNSLPFCRLHIYDLMLLSSSWIWEKLGRFQISVSWMSRLLSTPKCPESLQPLAHYFIERQKLLGFFFPPHFNKLLNPIHGCKNFHTFTQHKYRERSDILLYYNSRENKWLLMSQKYEKFRDTQCQYINLVLKQW